MKASRFVILFGLLLLVFVFGETAFSMTTYDAFSGTTIDGSKWDDQELVREIRQVGGNNKFFSRVTSYGTNTSNHLYVRNYGGIYYLEADVALISAGATYDPNDSNITTHAHAGLNGVFYNDGTSGSGSVGDVMAQVRLELSRGTLKVKWYVIKYTNPSGSTWDSLDSGTIGGAITLNTSYKLSVKYDLVTKNFTFAVGTNTVTPSIIGTTTPPRSDWKALRTMVQADVGYWGTVSATFDNAKAQNQAGGDILSDDFSAPTIDQTQWSSYEQVREVQNNHLHLKYRKVNLTSSASNSLTLARSEMINEIQAKVSLSDFQKSAPGSNLRVRVGGYFLNETGIPANNYLGEIFAAVYLGIPSNETTPKAGWFVTRTTDTGGNDTVNIGSGTLIPSVTLDENYTLYLKWDGGQFTFKCTDSQGTEYPGTFAPGTPVYPSNIKNKIIDVRIYPPSPYVANDSTIEATFDDIMTDIRNLFLPLILKN